MKESITPAEVCAFLNELLLVDEKCITELFRHHQRCNKKMRDHPTVQVNLYSDEEHPEVGIMGILNGMFGIREDGMGALCYEVSERGKLLCFKPTPD